jgi:hypothetical protein
VPEPVALVIVAPGTPDANNRSELIVELPDGVAFLNVAVTVTLVDPAGIEAGLMLRSKIFSGAAVAIVTGTTMAATASTNAATFAMNLRSRLIGGILSIIRPVGPRPFARR